MKYYSYISQNVLLYFLNYFVKNTEIIQYFTDFWSVFPQIFPYFTCFTYLPRFQLYHTFHNVYLVSQYF